MTLIIAINASGWGLPAQIIFAASKHQSLWYHELPEDYTISVSKNGWTTDEIGIEWLQKVFDPYTVSWTAGAYRLLILDGHESHATVGFDRFCMKKKIIPLYMPPHSSHFLQPLDVSCFAPLKHLTIWSESPGKDIKGSLLNWERRLYLYLSSSPSTSIILIKYSEWLCSN